MRLNRISNIWSVLNVSLETEPEKLELRKILWYLVSIWSDDNARIEGRMAFRHSMTKASDAR